MNETTQAAHPRQVDCIRPGLYRRADVLAILGINKEAWKAMKSRGLREIRLPGVRTIYVRGETLIDFFVQYEG